MKHQQVSVDFVSMVYTACSYLALAGAAWIFLRLLQACFSLPRHLKKQNDVQAMLQEKVDTYEKYMLECEEKEKRMEAGELTTDAEEGNDLLIGKENGMTNEEKWKERRECLAMLKRELTRVRDGGDVYDWDYLLEEDDKEEAKEGEAKEGEAKEGESKTEGEKCEDAKKDELSPSDVDCEIVENTNEEPNTEAKKDK